MWNFNCFDCNKVFTFQTGDEKKCPSCDGTNGEVVTKERLEEGMESGVYYNIDPKTGKRAKKKRR